jgi:hypothetical protein
VIASVRAVLTGLRAVVLAPQLLLVAALMMLVVAVPFALLLGSRLQTSLANQPPIAQSGAEIDPEWWAEFRQHARGLDATFTPAIIGFAAPLDNLSALADGTTRPWALAGPVGLAAAIWAWLWGGLIHRFARGRAIGVRAFVQAGVRTTPALLALSALGAVATLLLYATVHAWLLGPVFGWLADRAGSERDAFFWRVALYAVFLAAWMVLALVIDYARIAIVVSRIRLRDALGASWQFVRTHRGAVTGVYVWCGALFAVLMAVYAVAELYSGTRLGGWRAIAIGQAFIFGRLAIRLTLAASEVAVFQSVHGPGAGSGAVSEAAA